MKKVHLLFLALVVCFVLTHAVVYGQEFPIAVGSDTTFSMGAVYGGSIGIAAIHGNTNSQFTINAQLIGPGGTLVGERIFLGAEGSFPGAIPVFDGTKYFLVWREFNGDLKGQFLNTSGGLVGSSLTIATNVSIRKPGSFKVVVADTMFLIVYVKPDSILYGQRVGKSGSLIGSQIQISSNLAREVSLAYDGANFLAAWVRNMPDVDREIYGQFISKSGALFGGNFLIKSGISHHDDPASLAFDGNRYLLLYRDQPTTGGRWFLLGRFITTSGTIGETITIHDTSDTMFPSVAFDTQNYLITWTRVSDMSIMGRFYNTSGIPVDSPFVVFSPVSGRFPIGGVGYGGGLYLAVATRVDSNLTDGNVYGRFISPVTSVDYKNNPIIEKFKLSQNYPNPFNPSTTIVFSLPSGSLVSLKVFDFIGREVAILYSGELSAGTYEQRWDAANLPSGIYFYRLQAGSFSETKKLVLIR